MSSDETQSALSRAFDLVEAGNYGEARAILEPILTANKNNADAWWIYAHAVVDPEDGRDALENVVRIDPRYPGASELLAQAHERFPTRPKITSLVRPISVPEAPEHLPEVPTEPVPGQPTATQPSAAEAAAGQPVRDTRGQFAAAPPPSGRTPRRSNLPLIAALVVIIIIAGVAIVLLTQNGAPPAATATSVAALASATPLPIEAATAEATGTSEAALTVSASTAAATESIATLAPTTTEVVTAESTATQAVTEPPTAETAATQAVVASPTEQSAATQAVTEAPTEATVEATAQATAESAADSFAAIEQALSKYPVAESGVGEVPTSLGNTVLVTVCTTPGRAMRTLLPQVMNALAKESPNLGTTADALGVRMLDCGANAPLLTVAVDLATAQSYAKGDLSDSAFAGTWKPQ